MQNTCVCQYWSEWWREKSAVIKDNVYIIGPGVKIIGNITIESGAVIGANAVVTKDVPNGVTVGGIPAKVISEKTHRNT